MAHGEASRPLETTDGKSVDARVERGDRVLLTTDKPTQDLLREVLTVQRDILLALQGAYTLNLYPHSTIPTETAQGVPVRLVRGILTPTAPTAFSVGISSAIALAANPLRKGLVLVNTSGNVISLGFGTDAILASGVTLAAGASWTLSDADFTNLAVFAIASSGSSNLAIQEFI